MRPLKAIVATLACALMLAACSRSPVHEPEDAGSSWTLTWHDEFRGRALDPGRWRAEDRSTFGEGNLELACLMDRPENVSVSGGALHLTARREPSALPCGHADSRFPAGRRFSSAMVSTKGAASWTYGRFEIRARLPVTPGTSKGMWPAFWLRPDDGGVGEVDVFEAVGSSTAGSTKIHQTIWYDYAGTHPLETHKTTFPEGTSPAEDWHTYALEWSPGHLRWFIDQQQVYERTPETTPWFEQAFTRKFFLRLNLSVGGRWPGSPTAATRLPASFDVDYVRVWKRT